MNPHRYAWGPAREFPVAMVVAIATLMGFLLTREKSAPPKDKITILMILLWIVFVGTSFFAFNQETVWTHLTQVSKILLMIYVSLMLINDPRKLRYLLLVVALSLGLIAIKGGLWALATGGANRVYGPDSTFISDNNDVALAFNMTLPLIYYLGKDEKNFWLKALLKFALVMTPIAIVFTYSRGGFLAMSVVGFMLLLKARYKSLAVIILLAGVLLGSVIVPAKWSERMGTIETYQQDESAQGRLNVWKTAWNMALDRPLAGGGFEAFYVPLVFFRYSPTPSEMRDVHSIYFEMLGEQGFIGFFLYMVLLATSMTTLLRLKVLIRRNAELTWAQYIPDMLQVSLLGYMVGGAFLGRAYFDLFYQLIGVIVILQKLVLEKSPAPAKVSATRPVPAAIGVASPQIRLRS